MNRNCVATLALLLSWACISPAQPPAASETPVHKHTNRLIDETSPYLLQHAHNPVNWLPWGPEAFAKAKAENKPIFVSVGYSTCYWCHVMERESFEQEDVAEILNDHYVCIKVDREERPEVDQQYMMATQLMTGRGGWPNSVWLTTDGRPWMAGTYFPRKQFKLALLQMADVWQKRKDDVEKQAQLLTSAIERSGLTSLAAKPITQELIDSTLEVASTRFDITHGGFGTKPKFPPHAMLSVLIDQYRRNKQPRLLDMIDSTLAKMARGGVYDQIGGGFHRYSTDERWLLPHFEKMLYDNGQLLKSYTDGYLLTHNESHRATVEGIYTWIQREMTSSDGAFFSALDSESDAEEGKFYVWSHAEIEQVLGTEQASQFNEVYGVLAAGNFKEEATGHQSENNVLHQSKPNLELENALAPMRASLLSARSKRVYPHLDDKVLAAWNGLTIQGLAYAGRHLNEPKYVEAAQRAADFILQQMVRDGKLQRTYRASQAKLDGYLNDYAFFGAALLELYRATGQRSYLDQSIRMADIALAEFQDHDGGGFFFTSAAGDEKLEAFVIRSKNLAGGGNLPSGNGAMAVLLLDLADQTGEERYAVAARRTLDGLSGFLWQSAGQPDELLVAAARLLEREAPNSLASDADFQATAVRGRISVDPKRVAAGKRTTVALELTIADGWHLYSPDNDSDLVKVTRIEFPDTNPVKLVKLTQPEGREKPDPVFGKTLSVYEGKVTFSLELEVPADAVSGKQTIEFTVLTQACDARRCAAPAKSRVSIDLQVE